MEISWMCVLFISIIFSNKLLINGSFVHTIVNGNLQGSWQINYSIFAKEFKGVVLFCIDSNQNQFRVIVEKGNDGAGSLNINYNKIYKVVQLMTLCGCSSCDGTMVHLYIIMKNMEASIICNNRTPGTLIIGNKLDLTPEKGKTIYPIPKDIFDKKNLLSIRIGNIGPYVSKDGNETVPFKDQLVACLESFHYNYSPIQLQGDGTKMMPTCQRKCTDSLCNGGLCKEVLLGELKCDCSAAEGNGPFCNRSMHLYIPGAHNSYHRRENVFEMNMKMTWRQLHNKKYCLLNIVTRHEYFTLWIHKDKLMIAANVISKINEFGNNFINVIYHRPNFIIKTTAVLWQRQLLQIDDLRIHVGFSDISNDCDIFEGYYDLYYNNSQLRPTPWIELSSPSTTQKTYNVTHPHQIDLRNMILYISIPIFVIVLALCVLKIILFIKIRGEKVVSNTYEQEQIESDANPQQPYYSGLDYQGIGGSSDGYIELKQTRSEGTPPPLPGPRPGHLTTTNVATNIN